MYRASVAPVRNYLAGEIWQSWTHVVVPAAGELVKLGREETGRERRWCASGGKSSSSRLPPHDCCCGDSALGNMIQQLSGFRRDDDDDEEWVRVTGLYISADAAAVSVGKKDREQTRSSC